MVGIQFVTNEKGEKIAVQLDLKKHGELWQDIEDGLLSKARRNEKSMLFSEYAAKRRKRYKKDA